jgi:hypothetical protein
MSHDTRSNGEWAAQVEKHRLALKATLEVLRGKYGSNVREYGAKGHAHGHVTRTEHQVQSRPMAEDWTLT